MKKIFIILILLVCTLSACTAQKEESVPHRATQTHVDGQIIVRTIDELLETYPFVLQGTCLEKRWDEKQSMFTAKIKVDKLYQGELSEEMIVYTDTYDAFAEKKQLILFLQKWESVFTGEESFSGVPLQESEQGFKSKYVKGIEGYDEQELVRAIEEGMKTHSFSGQAVIGAYIKSHDIRTIVKESPYVAEVMVTSVRKGLSDDRERADVLLLDAVKGDMKSSFEVVVPVGSVKTGGRYMMMLDKPSESSTFYTVSSRNSIHPYNSKDVERVLKEMGEAE